MIWKKVKGYNNYMLSEKGDLYNIKTDIMQKGYTNDSGVKYVSLSKDGETQIVQLAKLVLDTFQPSQTTVKVCAWHNDLTLENCADENLERCTRGDRLRMFNEIKQKQRGVYPWKIGKNKFRVALKGRDGKYKTIGYYRTEFFARFQYTKAYKKEFGRLPY